MFLNHLFNTKIKDVYRAAGKLHINASSPECRTLSAADFTSLMTRPESFMRVFLLPQSSAG